MHLAQRDRRRRSTRRPGARRPSVRRALRAAARTRRRRGRAGRASPAVPGRASCRSRGSPGSASSRRRRPSSRPTSSTPDETVAQVLEVLLRVRLRERARHAARRVGVGGDVTGIELQPRCVAEELADATPGSLHVDDAVDDAHLDGGVAADRTQRVGTQRARAQSAEQRAHVHRQLTVAVDEVGHAFGGDRCGLRRARHRHRRSTAACGRSRHPRSRRRRSRTRSSMTTPASESTPVRWRRCRRRPRTRRVRARPPRRARGTSSGFRSRHNLRCGHSRSGRVHRTKRSFRRQRRASACMSPKPVVGRREAGRPGGRPVANARRRETRSRPCRPCRACRRRACRRRRPSLRACRRRLPRW